MTGRDFFPGFAARRLPGVDGVEIHARVGGAGPALLLLHGYPQTHVCWHAVAPRLAERFTVIAADMRGYGDSTAPPPDAAHALYSKRAMAADMVAAMASLGHDRFMVVGHDRGGRTAYRMALDHPQRVSRLALLDIISTADTWAAMDARGALQTYHWPFLAQPSPLPETLIGSHPAFYADWTLASWTLAGDLSAFDPDALTYYRALLEAPARLRAVCEDYRAGATYDRALDEADRAAGRRIACPVLALWGASNLTARLERTPLDHWRGWADDVSGGPIRSGHFLVEEAPDATLDALIPFLAGA